MAVRGAIGRRFCGRKFFGLRRVLRVVGDEGFGASTASSGAVVSEDFVVFAAGAGYWSEVAFLFLFLCLSPVPANVDYLRLPTCTQGRHMP